MHTGSIVDFYDDPNGFVLQQRLPEGLPDFIKTAEHLDENRRAKLPDDVFALVMVDGGEAIRKYACVDKGNTALSVIYFLENHDRLPEEAQKVAAANLLTACGWYDIEPPTQLQKLALEWGSPAHQQGIQQVQNFGRDIAGGWQAAGKAGLSGLGERGSLIAQQFGKGPASIGRRIGLGARAVAKPLAIAGGAGLALAGARRLLRGPQQQQPQPMTRTAAVEKTAGVLGFLGKKAIKSPLSVGLPLVTAPGQVSGKVHQGMERHQEMLGEPKTGELSGSRLMPSQSDRPEDEEKVAGFGGGWEHVGQMLKEDTPTLREHFGALKQIPGLFGEGAKRFSNVRYGLPGSHPLEGVSSRIGAAARLAAKPAAVVAGGLGAGYGAYRLGKHLLHRHPEEQVHTAEALRPYVDVTGKEPPLRIEKVASKEFIKIAGATYSLDSYSEVEEAKRWFNDYSESLHPADRREFCVKLAARADALDIDLPDPILKYAGKGYASDEEVERDVNTRRQLWGEYDPERSMLDRLMEKKAEVSPDVFCEALRQFDEITGLSYRWDEAVVDPWSTTYGITKTAGTDWTFEYGGDRVDEPMLKRLALSSHKQLCKKFGREVVEELGKKPKEIFSSLPLDSKRIIMRMANDPQP